MMLTRSIIHSVAAAVPDRDAMLLILALLALVGLVAGIGYWFARRDFKKLPPQVTVAMHRDGFPQVPQADEAEAYPVERGFARLWRRVPRAAQARSARVTAVSGPLEGKSAAVRSAIKIGRKRGCALRFAAGNAQISRVHCALYYDARAHCFYLEDLFSTNGTYLADGARVEPGAMARLEPGDSFYIGAPDIRFRVEETA